MDRAINVTFHGIGDPGRRLDPGEADAWISREHFLAVLDSLMGRDDVRITFDDGNASDVELALPALLERDLTATFFVVAGRMGAPRFLDAAGVEQLTAAGMVVGCHGMGHRPWRGLDEHTLREELVDAKAMLEGVVGHPVTQAACPFGSYDRRVLRRLRGAGYRRVYTSDGGPTGLHEFLQARNTVHRHDEPAVVERIARFPAHRALTRRAKLTVKRWR